MFLYISAYNLYKNFTWLIIPEIVLFSINCKQASPPPIISFDTTGSVFLFRFLNGTTSAKQRDRVVHCDVASRDSYFPFDSYPSHSRARLFHWRSNPVGVLFNTARHSPLFCSTLLLFSSSRARVFEKKTRDREREKTELRSLKIEWK